MGNTDSQSGLVPPARSSSSSLRFSSRREVVPSAHSWWRSSQGGRGRNYQSQHADSSPYTSWCYEHAAMASRLQSPQPFVTNQLGYMERGGGSKRTSVESGGSPKVLLSKDGSMRVEFTNSRVVSVEPQGLASLPTASAATAVPEPSLRTSKGSSLSSNGSWYDSPWGMASELTDNTFEPITYSSTSAQETTTSSGSYNTFFSAQVSPAFTSDLLCSSTAGYNSCSSGRTEDSGIGDSMILVSPSCTSLDNVYSNHNTLSAFPTAPDASLQQETTSSSSDVIQEEEGSADYSSLTLPCRSRAEPVSPFSTCRNNRKDSLKSRIRRLSDWTGSLNRKKRRIQEPFGNVSCDVGPDTLWSCNPLHQNQVPAVHRGSSKSLNHSSDAQRQNVYDTFMQELESGCSSIEHPELSEEDEDEEEVRGDEQLLLEKEHGVVRRAGWLSLKALLAINKDRKLELVARRRWRRYWVTLKGCTLLLYETYGRNTTAEQELSPRYALLAADSIVQAVPEHPKKEHVFCLSNSHGDVYLLQATNQTDLENWVTAIHSASASLLAKREGKEDTLRLLRCRSRSLLHKIDTDGKMKKMAELQLSVIKEPKSRKAVESQIQQWEQNLEKLNLDLFRLRCYLSSLQGGELPNPKSLLAVASRPSKTMLGRLGVFSVSSFHALVCSRNHVTLRRRSLSGGNHRRRGLLSSMMALDEPDRCSKHAMSQRQDSVSNQRLAAPPTGCPAAVQVNDELQLHHIFTLKICRLDAEEDFGFAVMGHVDGRGRNHTYVSDVEPLGLSARKGLRVGDEVLALNGVSVSGLDMDLLQSLFSHQKLQLLLRRDKEPPTTSCPCPAEPGQTPAPAGLQDIQVWSPGTTNIESDSSHPDFIQLPVFNQVSWKQSTLQKQNMDRLFCLYQTFPECRAADADVPRNPYSREDSPQPASPAHLSVCQRLRSVIHELVHTEKSYVKDLVCLFDIYLTPLQDETFLSKEEMEALFGSLPGMLDFQKVFLQTLEERISSCPDLGSLETPGQFKKLLFSLGGSFLYYADHFKHYSGFCANHVKVQKVLERAKTDKAFKHFLEARNPTNQHSSSLESYLIKPVQRVLKYPLLLRELVSLTDPESPEHTHLTEALRAMEKVASHINEMQKIYEDYGCVFDQLAAEHSGPHKKVTEISMGDFLIHSSVLWLNPLPCLGRLRKEPELTLFVFKRAVILVYRDSSKMKKRMTGPRSADPDPFRFRWLIPVSSIQVRPANITENSCVWELVHSRSEVEGRPETVFQLCSSGLETKANVLRALCSLLRDRAPAGSLRKSSSWRRRHRRSNNRRMASGRPEESSCNLGETCSEPLLRSPATSTSAGRRTRLCSLTSELETQLQRLNFTEEEEAERGAAEEEEERRSFSLRPAGDVLDLLERDFSVNSITSMINEDCFYDSTLHG